MKLIIDELYRICMQRFKNSSMVILMLRYAQLIVYLYKYVHKGHNADYIKLHKDDVRHHDEILLFCIHDMYVILRLYGV